MMRNEVVGVDEVVPLLDGRSVPYVNLDNAATTPPLRAVLDEIERFLPLAASVHRGSGYKSRLSTAAFEEARAIVGDFLGADPDRDVVVFTKNTTEAINRFARTLPVPDGSVIVTTVLEHHSNLLPWRRRGTVVHVRANADGSLDLEHLDATLRRYAGRVALLAVTGASNVTGIVPDVHRMAAQVHAAGGRILVDAAQLAGHRPIDMRPHDDAGHLDAVAVSAHKLYAPFGSGALVTGRDLCGADPDERGGGTVRAVTLDDVVWADLPDRVEAGSPNLLGAVAFAAAVRRLRAIGLERIADREGRLAAHARRQLATVPGVSVLGPSEGALGVIPFTVRGRDHRLVAAVLGHEHGVGVRSGCFCAQPYVHHLLGLSAREVARWVADARRRDLRHTPGVVRISLGSYNDCGDIDRAVEGLRQIVVGPLAGSYFRQDDGSYLPAGESTPRWFADQAQGSRPSSHNIRRHAAVARAAPARSPSAAAAAISTR